MCFIKSGGCLSDGDVGKGHAGADADTGLKAKRPEQPRLPPTHSKEQASQSLLCVETQKCRCFPVSAATWVQMRHHEKSGGSMPVLCPIADEGILAGSASGPHQSQARPSDEKETQPRGVSPFLILAAPASTARRRIPKP